MVGTYFFLQICLSSPKDKALGVDFNISYIKELIMPSFNSVSPFTLLCLSVPCYQIAF